jgi:DNA-binding NarL/FixJ family response regulator
MGSGTAPKPEKIGGLSLSARPRCLVVDDHPVVRIGVRRLLADDFEVEDAASHEEALELVRDVGNFDVAIVDMRSPANGGSRRISGRDTIGVIHRTEPSLGIVAYGDRAERHLATEAIQAGASAYVARGTDAAQLKEAVHAALEDKDYVDPAVPPKGSRGRLTRRQREILQMLADGGSTTQAARELDLSEETVKTHTKHILARLDAQNRTHAVAIALRGSLIE